MSNEYFDIEEFDSPEVHQEEPFDEPQEDDWVAKTEYEIPTADEGQWLTENSFADATYFRNSDVSEETGDDWSVSNTSKDNVETENAPNNHNSMTGSTISFTGCGRCECGCGSFGGHGDICTYCGHPYSAHSRYKK